jgi:hypothetical protein
MRATLLAVVAACALLAGPSAAPAAAQSATLRFQIIEADGFTATDPAIADVQKVLSELFRFRGYRLAAEAVIRASGGFSQQVAAVNGQVYTISGDGAGFVGEGHRAAGQFYIDGLTLWTDETSVVLQTSLTMPVGQTVVVGSAKPSGEAPTLILVVKPVAP